MRIEAPARIRKPLPLIPLVDVVFLLLMFFMLSSTFAKFSSIELGGTAGKMAGVSTPRLPDVIIKVSSGPRIKVNGSDVGLDGLVPKLNEAQARGAISGVIVVSLSATAQDLVAVLERARSSKLRSVSVAR
ncbi:MAG: ExbD/TolR family protein [Hyphomicrobiales bacterium]